MVQNHALVVRLQLLLKGKVVQWTKEYTEMGNKAEVKKETAIKTVVPNLGRPVIGENVAWVKGMKEQKLIRVHVQGKENLTACRALNTKDSPYIGTGGHIAFRTTAKVTCQPCSRFAPVVKKAKKAAKVAAAVEALGVVPTEAPAEETQALIEQAS